MKRVVVAVCLMALAGVALAQSAFDGKWTGAVGGARGATTPVALTFKAEGAKLTGSLAGARGVAVPIADGVISGSAIRFKTSQEARDGSLTVFAWTGVLKEGDIAVSREPITPEGKQTGPPVEFTIKRAP